MVITIGNKSEGQKIKKKFEKLGFKNVYFFWEFYDFHTTYERNFITKKKSFFYKNIQNIKAAYNELDDLKSKRIFMQILNTFLSKKIYKISNMPLNDQFFPTDIKLYKGYKTFFNCGSFTGDTILQMKKKKFFFKI